MLDLRLVRWDSRPFRMPQKTLKSISLFEYETYWILVEGSGASVGGKCRKVGKSVDEWGNVGYSPGVSSGLFTASVR